MTCWSFWSLLIQTVEVFYSWHCFAGATWRIRMKCLEVMVPYTVWGFIGLFWVVYFSVGLQFIFFFVSVERMVVVVVVDLYSASPNASNGCQDHIQNAVHFVGWGLVKLCSLCSDWQGLSDEVSTPVAVLHELLGSLYDTFRFFHSSFHSFQQVSAAVWRFCECCGYTTATAT